MVIKKILTSFSLFFKGDKHLIFERIFLDKLPRWTGALSLRFYRRLYRNLTIGKGIKCWGSIYLVKSKESSILMGDNLHIVSSFRRRGISIFSKLNISAFFNSKIDIANNVGLNGTSISCRTTRISIGEGTIIAPNVVITDSDFHALWPAENRILNMGYENDRPVRIGKNVWLGMNVIVLKGVTIGDNSIIGAGSVVTKDIPANVLAAGNPARVIKSLNLDNE